MKCSNIAATKYYAIPEGFDKESVVQIKCVGVNAFVLSVDDKDKIGRASCRERV